MRILRAVPSLNPQHGGVTEAVRSTTIGLQRLGHTVDLVTLDNQDEPYLSDFPAQIHALGTWIKRYGYTPRLRRWIVKYGQAYDVGIIEGLWNHASIGGYQGMRDAGLPYIVFPHGMMDPWFRSQYPIKHLVKQLFWWTLQGRVLGDAAAVAFTCEEEKRVARGVFFGPAYHEEVISLGIAAPPSLDTDEAAIFGERLPALAGRPYLLFMSRIHPKKGCDLLIRAFAELAKVDGSIQLVMAGPDQVGWQSELIELSRTLGIADRIHWPGMLEGVVKWAAMRSSEAFVLPSHQENFGIVVAEAMACGKAVLTTDKVNIWHEVKASGGGLIENDSQDGISRLLQRWHTMSPEERREMQTNAQNGFSTCFHIDSAVQGLERLLLSVKRKKAA